jgi:2-polyprenyl-3-methyl-5-hydroxy-6-metoxy-1,4-benzoquinol methylase
MVKDCDYVGVDWREGQGVDVVCLAHEFPADRRFDTVLSASMLEHDPYWEKSLEKMVEVLKDDGMLFISWGAYFNGTHEEDMAPDGKFHALPAGYVLKKIAALGMNIIEFKYENNIHETGTKGETCLIAVKGESPIIPDIDDLLPEDEVKVQG